MNPNTFRAVAAAVLVGALALAIVVTVTLLPGPSPTPGPSATTSPAPSSAPPDVATPSAGPAFGPPQVVGVGEIARGSGSGSTLVLEFTEPQIDAIADGPGSFLVTLTDSDGSGSTVGFVGTASVAAPGSLGATVRLAADNVLMVSIGGSDRLNIEPITISGLGIRAGSSAALGPVVAELGDFTGSLAPGAAGILSSPGSVVKAR